MHFTSENILLISSVLIFCSILISKAGYRFGLPSLLLFLIAGMLFGSDGLGLQFNNMNHAQFIGMIALCVILFTGGMETKFKEIKPVLGEGLALSTIGVLLTTVFTGLFIFLLSEWDMAPISLPLVTCILLAATMSSTDSASVFNILRNSRMKLKNNLQPLLELESGSNDPMAYILTIVLIQIANTISGAGSIDAWTITADALKTLVLQFGVGIISGKQRIQNGAVHRILLAPCPLLQLRQTRVETVWCQPFLVSFPTDVCFQHLSGIVLLQTFLINLVRQLDNSLRQTLLTGLLHLFP